MTNKAVLVFAAAALMILVWAVIQIIVREKFRCQGTCGESDTSTKWRAKYQAKLCDYCLMEREFVQFHRGDEMRWDKERAR